MRVRLFCDICDVFDKHDTEDCPLQSNEEIGSKHHGERGVERPYCTTCESKKVYMKPAVYLNFSEIKSSDIFSLHFLAIRHSIDVAPYIFSLKKCIFLLKCTWVGNSKI